VYARFAAEKTRSSIDRFDGRHLDLRSTPMSVRAFASALARVDQRLARA
jgi:hypothetical protein